MAPKSENNRPSPLSQDEFTAMLTMQMKDAVRFALSTILEAEVTALIGALPYEHSVSRTDQRNGHYARNLGTTVGLIEDLAVPRTRGGFQTQLFERSNATLGVAQRWTRPSRPSPTCSSRE